MQRSDARRLHSGFMDAFHEAFARGELLIALCPRCERSLAYTQRVCPAHPDADIEWRPACGRANLHSVVKYHITYTDGVPAPYQVAVVELEEGPRLVSAIESGQDEQVAAGQPLRMEIRGGKLVFLAQPAAAPTVVVAGTAVGIGKQRLPLKG